MKILLLSVGKPRDRLTLPLHDRYAVRIAKLGVGYRSAHVPETAIGGRYSDSHVKEREANALRQALPTKGVTVALDPRGKAFSSESLAAKLERWASPELALVLGGPLGLAPDFVAECDSSWSLSPLTFPHELARVMVAEQLFRALAIRAGIPYHK